MAHQLLEICIHDNPKKSNRFCPTKEKSKVLLQYIDIHYPGIACKYTKKSNRFCPTKEKLKVLLKYIDIHYRGIACKYTKKVTDFVRQKRER